MASPGLGVRRHVKIPGYVHSLGSGDRWTAVLRLDTRPGPYGDEVIADMSIPLPPDKRDLGIIFTIHRTRRGHTYLFFPPPWTDAQIRRQRWAARRRYRRYAHLFQDTDA